MSVVNAQIIERCSLTLGQFDSDSVKTLVALFRNQNASRPLTRLAHNLKEQFEDLLSCKAEPNLDKVDTPLTRIELALMINFKERYLTKIFMDSRRKETKYHSRFDVNDDITLAYCYLIAEINDRILPDIHLRTLAFFLNLRGRFRSLFEMYESFHQPFPNFISALTESTFFDQQLVPQAKTLRGFQSFIVRYEKFLKNFHHVYKTLPNTEQDLVEIDAIADPTKPPEITSVLVQILSITQNTIKDATKRLSSSNLKEEETHSSSSETSVSPFRSPPKMRSSTVSPTLTTSKCPRQGLCVIININKFETTEIIEGGSRPGSEKDVDIVRLIFHKLKFTILECQRDFTQNDLDNALNYIDDPAKFGTFDCLVMFIMSHG